MQPNELLARGKVLFAEPRVRAMYDSFHQLLLEVMAAQGFGDRREKSAHAEAFNCKDGAELLCWDELFDPHTNHMMLLSLSMLVFLDGPGAGNCGLTARICYPDSNMAETAYTVFRLSAEPGFDASEHAVGQLAERVLQRTVADEAWLGWEAADFADWLEKETTA